MTKETNRTSIKFASDFVTKKEPFTASNTFGKWVKDLYVVYSYGYHYPMFVWDDIAQAWFENITKSTRSTEKQKVHLRPNAHVEYKLDTGELMQLVSAGGLFQWTVEKARG
jgi:hypothetical protein